MLAGTKSGKVVAWLSMTPKVWSRVILMASFPGGMSSAATRPLTARSSPGASFVVLMPRSWAQDSSLAVFGPEAPGRNFSV